MSMKLISKHKKIPLEIEYVTKYNLNIETPKTSIAKTYEEVNDMVITLEVPKADYDNEDVQKLLVWAKLPFGDEDYYRDLIVNMQVMENFERTIAFTHAVIRTNVITVTKADFVTIEVYAGQKDDKFVGVAAGESVEETYEAAFDRVNNPPRLNIWLPVPSPESNKENAPEDNKEYASSGTVSPKKMTISEECVFMYAPGYEPLYQKVGFKLKKGVKVQFLGSEFSNGVSWTYVEYTVVYYAGHDIRYRGYIETRFIEGATPSDKPVSMSKIKALHEVLAPNNGPNDEYVKYPKETKVELGETIQFLRISTQDSNWAFVEFYNHSNKKIRAFLPATAVDPNAKPMENKHTENFNVYFGPGTGYVKYGTISRKTDEVEKFQILRKANISGWYYVQFAALTSDNNKLQSSKQVKAYIQLSNTHTILGSKIKSCTTTENAATEVRITNESYLPQNGPNNTIYLNLQNLAGAKLTAGMRLNFFTEVSAENGYVFAEYEIDEKKMRAYFLRDKIAPPPEPFGVFYKDKVDKEHIVKDFPDGYDEYIYSISKKRNMIIHIYSINPKTELVLPAVLPNDHNYVVISDSIFTPVGFEDTAVVARINGNIYDLVGELGMFHGAYYHHKRNGDESLSIIGLKDIHPIDFSNPDFEERRNGFKDFHSTGYPHMVIYKNGEVDIRWFESGAKELFNSLSSIETMFAGGHCLVYQGKAASKSKVANKYNPKIGGENNDTFHISRSILGHTPSGKMYLINTEGETDWLRNKVLDDETKGMNLEDAEKMLVDMGCDYALNLDGGGPTAMYLCSRNEMVYDTERGKKTCSAICVVKK